MVVHPMSGNVNILDRGLVWVSSSCQGVAPLKINGSYIIIYLMFHFFPNQVSYHGKPHIKLNIT